MILTELLLRRRIQRILVLTPASLRRQWREDLWEKFSLQFEVVDRQGTERLRRRLGMDATPWRSFSRIVASYHYLRQPDVLEQFLACRAPEGSPHLPWDLLIVDECHNLMPSPFGEDSELCRMLRLVAPQFEHRLFLSATPHNGHTRSFTGLLEMLDPVRFTRTSEMSAAMRGRVEDIVVRRLKRDINARSATPRFCARHPPRGAPPRCRPARNRAVHGRSTPFAMWCARSCRRDRRPAAAPALSRWRSWASGCSRAPPRSPNPGAGRDRGSPTRRAAPEAELAAAERTVRQETGDDREAQEREATAATVVGAWLRNFIDDVGDQIRDIEAALDTLGFDLDGAPITKQTPVADARFETLVLLIERLLRENAAHSGGAGEDGAFHPGERLIVFTEYKTTLDYLARRLRERYPADRVLTLFGSGGPEGMDETGRVHVKAAFNDPAAPVRVLVATDAASEGLNLHRTARYLLHYDCPWNPPRLEQHNGRIDRLAARRNAMREPRRGSAEA